MPRLKQNQNIDRIIQSIITVTKNRCSLSVEELNFFNEALTTLQRLRKKKGKTNEEILSVVVPVVEKLARFSETESVLKM